MATILTPYKDVIVTRSVYDYCRAKLPAVVNTRYATNNYYAKLMMASQEKQVNEWIGLFEKLNKE